MELHGWIQAWGDDGRAFRLRHVDAVTDCILAPDARARPDEVPPESRVRAAGHYDAGGRVLLVERLEVLASAPPLSGAGRSPAGGQLAFRHLHVRDPRLAAVFRVRHHLLRSIHDFFDTQGFSFVTAPILGGVMTACEDIDRSFALEHAGQTLFLSQSARVYKEALVYSLGRVYLIQPSFRRDSRSPRHLQEFWQLEAEWLDAEEDDVIALEEQLVAALCADLVETSRADLEVAGADVEQLRTVSPPFARIEYETARAELGLGAEDAIDAAHEVELTRRLGGPVVLLHFPGSLKGFYARPLERDPSLVQTHDILFPGFGEVFGGAVRNTDERAVRDLVLRPEYIDKIRALGFDVEHHDWYLDLRRYGGAPHGGFGCGIERLLQWACGLEDIADAIPFPRVEGHYDP